MNAPVNLNQTTIQTLPTATGLALDKKRYWWLLSPGLPVIGMGILAGYQFGPKVTKKIFALGGPLLLHVIIPSIDAIVGTDNNNPSDDQISSLVADPYYDHIVKLFIPLQMAANVFAGYVVSRKTTSLLDQILLGVSMGAINGIGVNTAHELSHRPNKKDHYLSHATLMPLFYNHFRVEHPYGHHKRAATPEDPASSKMGETFYEFWPRTVFGGLKSAVEIERNRLKRKGLSFFSPQNELFQGWAMSVGFHATMLKLFGKDIIPYLATQAFYGVSLFEIINYIEHYGLMRDQKEDGSYARTMPEHSWNNNNITTNLFLYQLQRHSDHHAYPTRPFQALRNFEQAPELPSGYATMLLPALVPSLWFKMMDKRVFDHYEGDLNKANIHPKRRAKIFKKFGVVDRLLNKE
ncbi:alkane 1-monooxygenase [Acinetobacter bohemicus]|uniref:Alkane 1-monooxygenase n=1 Tax=Acinetobacter bohemicus TaxID=1435036 RepID=A0A1I6VUY3_9GAMM|nr:alkane 1-monooxygenase [Acinetobacter bohemicus]KAB0651001.1 alkane 1-monooxygenase [Acinetobacter bohemicus]SFT17518.1 alkane 1-monooxygenase [Acinetobacter bohemicus]